MAKKKTTAAVKENTVAGSSSFDELKPIVSLSRTGSSVYTDRRSEFIGTAIKISSEEEARELVAAEKKRHPDARHTVFAYRLKGGAVKRYSDDGEPQGSAGMPVLDVLEKNGIEGALITVTRYFGGILLGTGGLVRAYSTAASEALADARPLLLIPHLLIEASFDYTDWSKCETALKRAGAAVRSTGYGEKVNVILSAKKELGEELAALVTELTAGRSHAEITGSELLPEQDESGLR